MQKNRYFRPPAARRGRTLSTGKADGAAMKFCTPLAGCFLCAALMTACASPGLSNAPPEVAARCQAEASADQRDPAADDRNEPFSPVDSGANAAMEDAATANAEAAAGSLELPPADVMLYRCLAANGVTLTTEQSAVLVKWQDRSAGEAP